MVTEIDVDTFERMTGDKLDCLQVAALGRDKKVLRHDLTCEQESSVHLASVCRWLSDHPWQNLWAWVKRKLGCAE